MITHLRELTINLLKYFPSDNYDFLKRSILNPFDESIVSVAKLPVKIHNKLLQLSADKILQLQFSSQDLIEF